jgi:hypothetical protein
MVVDVSRTGALIGVELLDPEYITLVQLNRVLEQYGKGPPEESAEAAPEELELARRSAAEGLL